MGGGQDTCALLGDLLGAAVVHGGRRQEPDAGVPVLVVVPGEEAPSPGAGVENRVEAVREFRTVMYTTNAIESMNAQLRKVTKKRGAFPGPDAIRKVLYLAIMKASERWTRPLKDWPAALNHFALLFPDRMSA